MKLHSALIRRSVLLATATGVVAGAAVLASGSASAATPSLTCDHLVSGTSGAVVATKGLTCVQNAHVHGAITVTKGAQLFVQSSVVDGAITGQKPAGFAVCGTEAASISVTGSTAGVLIGNDLACGPNRVHGSITVVSSKGGVNIIGNTVGGAVVTHDNKGTEVVSGNHP